MEARALITAVAVLALLANVSPGRAQQLSGEQAPLWRYVTGGTVTGPPAISDSGTVYVAAADRYLYALDSGGKRKWRFDLAALPSTAARVTSSGIVLAATEDSLFRAISGNGRLRFRSVLESPVVSMLLRRNGTLQLLLENGKLVSLTDLGTFISATSLRLEKAEALLGATARVSYVLGSERVVSVSGNGELRWTMRMPAISGAAAVDGAGALLLGDSGGRLYRISPEGERSVLYRADAPLEAIRTLLPSDGGNRRAEEAAERGSGGAIALLDERGTVYMLDGSGASRWRAAPPGAQTTDIAFTDSGELLMANAASQLFLLNSDGTLSGSFSLQDGDSPLSLNVRDGVAVITDRSWISAAFAVPGGRRGGWRAAAGPANNSATLELQLEAVGREAWWEEEFDYIYLREHILSQAERDRRKALEEISRRIDGQTLHGSYDYIVSLLRRSLVEPFRYPKYRDGAVVNDWPQQRRRAAVLLSRIATTADRGQLLRALRTEYDWEVRAAITEALGVIAIDRDGAVAQTISELLRAQHASRPNGAFVAAALSALRSIAAYAPANSMESVVDALAWIQESDAARSQRERASALLRGLAGGGQQ